MFNTKLKLTIYLVALLYMMVGFATRAQAATLYMPDSCANLHECFPRMSSGDTLIIRDGTYSGDENMITENYSPPDGPGSGLSRSGDDRFTIVKAENRRGVVLNGGTNSAVIGNLTTEHSWIKFERIHFRRDSSNAAVVEIGHSNANANASNHIYFSHCSFMKAGGSFSSVWLANDYNLFEDCHFWGGAKYLLHFHSPSNYNIVRRSVFRPDDMNGGGQPIAAAMSYEADYVEWQNNIILDADRTKWTNFSYDLGGFATHVLADSGNDADGLGGTFYNYYRGNIVLNNNWSWTTINNGGKTYETYGSGFQIDQSTTRNCEYHDNIIWGNQGKGISGAGRNIIIDKNTIGQTIDINLGNYHPSGIDSLGDASNVIKNSIVYGGSRWGISRSANGKNDYNNVFGNVAGNYTSATRGVHDDNSTDPTKTSLLYLPQIENGSAFKTSGEDNGQIGATVLKKYGVTGTFYGEGEENEYARLTSEDLWPWSDEDIIKNDMSSYNPAGGPSGTRGFCEDGNGLYGGPITLTSYIWEYLGNPCPENICNYDAQGDTTPPAAPHGLTVQ